MNRRKTSKEEAQAGKPAKKSGKEATQKDSLFQYKTFIYNPPMFFL